MTSDDVLLRRASDADARAAADVWLCSFAASLPSVRCAHNDDEIRDWFSRVLVPQYELGRHHREHGGRRDGAQGHGAEAALPRPRVAPAGPR